MTDTVCPVNIGPRERAKRRWMGVIAVVAGVSASVWLNSQPHDLLQEILVVAPWGFGTLCLLQARTGT